MQLIINAFLKKLKIFARNKNIKIRFKNKTLQKIKTKILFKNTLRKIYYF